MSHHASELWRALSGVGGIAGIVRVGGGSIFILLGILWTRSVLADRHGWFSVELRDESWYIKVGVGGHVDRAIALSIKNASTRIEWDRQGSVDGVHMIFEDLTVRYDEPLPQIVIGEGYGLEREQLEAIAAVVAEQARMRAHEPAREPQPKGTAP